MIARSRTSFVTTVLTGGMLACACGPAAADTLSGKVLGGGQPITNSTVTLWAASEGAPQQLGRPAPEPMVVLRSIQRVVPAVSRFI